MSARLPQMSAVIHGSDEFVPTKALLVVAHPDDIDFGACGTACLLVDHGVEVVYGIVTDGDAGVPEEIPADELRALRHDEQTAAAKIAGVTELHWLGFPDGALVADLELRKAISRLIRIVKPDLVITQSPVRDLDRIYAAHPDHLAAGEATVSAVYPDARNPKSFPALLDEGHQPHAVDRVWLMAAHDSNVHVDISTTIDRKIEALLAHHSQNDHWADTLPAMIRDWASAQADAAELDDAAVESFRVIVTG